MRECFFLLCQAGALLYFNSLLGSHSLCWEIIFWPQCVHELLSFNVETTWTLWGVCSQRHNNILIAVTKWTWTSREPSCCSVSSYLKWLFLTFILDWTGLFNLFAAKMHLSLKITLLLYLSSGVDWCVPAAASLAEHTHCEETLCLQLLSCPFLSLITSRVQLRGSVLAPWGRLASSALNIVVIAVFAGVRIYTLVSRAS